VSTSSHVKVKLGLFEANTTMELSGPQAADTAKLAEALGLESVWAADHIVIPADYDATYPYAESGKLPDGETRSWPDPFIWLAYTAAVTHDIRLATGVTVLPQRNPLVVAKQVATLDVLSGGRVLLGVGVGWLKDEFEALGVPFSDRGRRHDAYLEAIQALWTQEKATVDNGFVQFRDAISLPRPAARIPIVISGHSEAAARRAARYGDGLFPGVTNTDQLQGLLSIVAEECQILGREPSEIELTVFPGQSDVDAVSTSIERYTAAGVSRILLPRLPDDQLQHLVAVLADRFEVMPAI
jgi:probable F420-dependent oxidoreductase